VGTSRFADVRLEKGMQVRTITIALLITTTTTTIIIIIRQIIQ
jgi:hypothetical protein